MSFFKDLFGWKKAEAEAESDLRDLARESAVDPTVAFDTAAQGKFIYDRIKEKHPNLSDSELLNLSVKLAVEAQFKHIIAETGEIPPPDVVARQVQEKIAKSK